MKSRGLFAAGLIALASAILAENLFGGELNAFFLRYPGIDKVLHTIEYALVVVLVHALARRTTVVSSRSLVPAAVIASVAIAIVDESAQRLFPARSVDTLDFVANLSGAALGWAIVSRPRRWLRMAAVGLALATSTFVSYRTHVTLIDYTRALAFERQHDFVRAREYYQRALAAGLRSPALFNELGWVEIESGVGDPKAAVAYAATALEMQPNNPDVLDTYGWALLHAGRTREAVTVLEKAFAASPDMYCIDYHLGAAYLASGRPDDARHHFTRQIQKPGTREAVFARQALDRLGSD